VTRADSERGPATSCPGGRADEAHPLTRHVDRLYRAAWAMCGSSQHATDLTREAFARALSGRRLPARNDELPELFHALRGAVASSRRRASRRAAGSAAFGCTAAEGPAPGTGAVSGPGVHEVYASVAHLPQTMREALVAVDVLGLTHQQAARALGVTEETIAARLLRGRTELAADPIAVSSGPAPVAR
jgi:RNA polymerase sigma-70 factor, ECF subfamily